MKSGKINFIDTELTNEQFTSLGYPALYILKNSSNTVTKFIIFDLNGIRTDYDASKVNYRVEITSTNGNLFKNDVIETTLIARVYFGSEDITDSLPQNSFRWKRVSDDSTADIAWNRLHQNLGSNILNIDSDDVDSRAVFNCEVKI